MIWKIHYIILCFYISRKQISVSSIAYTFYSKQFLSILIKTHSRILQYCCPYYLQHMTTTWNYNILIVVTIEIVTIMYSPAGLSNDFLNYPYDVEPGSPLNAGIRLIWSTKAILRWIAEITLSPSHNVLFAR